MKSFIQFITENSVPERVLFRDSLIKAGLSKEAQEEALKQWDARPENLGKNIDWDKLERDAEIEHNLSMGPHIGAYEPSPYRNTTPSFTDHFIAASRNLHSRDPISAQIGLGHLGGRDGTPTVGATHALTVAAVPAAVPRIVAQTAASALAPKAIDKAFELTTGNASSPEGSTERIAREALKGAASWLPFGIGSKFGNALRYALTGAGIGGGIEAAGQATETGARKLDIPDYGTHKDLGPITSGTQEREYKSVGDFARGTLGDLASGWLVSGAVSPNPVVRGAGALATALALRTGYGELKNSDRELSDPKVSDTLSDTASFIDPTTGKRRYVDVSGVNDKK